MGHGEPRKAKIITKGVKRGDFITLFGFHKEAKKNDEEEKKKKTLVLNSLVTHLVRYSMLGVGFFFFWC